MKGRAVFDGRRNQVKDQDWKIALHAELSSSPAAMEDSKVCDALGLRPGWSTRVADADPAYTQCKLGGPRTYVRLPDDAWPPEWRGRFKDPVVPLDKALYGHPGSGGHGERLPKD